MGCSKRLGWRCSPGKRTDVIVTSTVAIVIHGQRVGETCKEAMPRIVGDSRRMRKAHPRMQRVAVDTLVVAVMCCKQGVGKVPKSLEAIVGDCERL